MATPRQVLQGTTYLITRRCADRRFLLTPDGTVRAVFLYCLAIAARLSGMRLHAICVMSNHYHLVATDVVGLLPEFMQWLNRHTANCLKLHRSWRGCFWEPSERYSAVALTTPKAVLEKLVYLIANPVSAGLVPKASDWPGIVTRPGAWRARPVRAVRPKLYFRSLEDPVADLQFTIPPQFADWEPEEFAKHLERRVRERESAIREEMRSARRSFLGAERVRKQAPLVRPKTEERRGSRNPEFAAMTREGIRESKKNLRSFRAHYRDARLRFRKGDHCCLFPPGTWWVVRHAGARCVPGVTRGT